jgi:polysaccharide pyruvyl transferase WcaK-like protein
MVLSRFVDLTLAREAYSAKLLDELGVKNYQIVTDVAHIDKRHHSPTISFQSFKPTIGIAPAMLRYTPTKEEIEKYIVAHARCLDDLVAQHEEIVFLPPSSDDMSQMIMARVKNAHRAKIIVTDKVGEYESLIRRLKLLITARMHPSIIAAKNFIPFISIVYDRKQVGFLSQIGLKVFSIPIGKTTYK